MVLNLLRRLQPAEFWTNRDDWRLLFLSRLYPIRGVYENDAKESDDLTTKSKQKICSKRELNTQPRAM